MPLNSILADGFEFKCNKIYQTIQLYRGEELMFTYPVNRPVGYRGGLIANLYKFLKSYLDQPINTIDEFDKDFDGRFRELLLALDKRRGRHRLLIQALQTDSPLVRTIISHRLRRKTPHAR